MKKTILLAISLIFASAASVQAADVTANWKKHCASCHGKDGRGRTKAGRKAKAKDLTDAKYQGKFTDEKMHQQIKEGMIVDGKEKMKAYGDKLNEDEIKALVAFVRKFKK